MASTFVSVVLRSRTGLRSLASLPAVWAAALSLLLFSFVAMTAAPSPALRALPSITPTVSLVALRLQVGRAATCELCLHHQDCCAFRSLPRAAAFPDIGPRFDRIIVSAPV